MVVVVGGMRSEVVSLGIVYVTVNVMIDIFVGGGGIVMRGL